jgi:5'-methylthioadenosine phosphorylase
MGDVKAEVGIFGGSGFYKFLDHVEEITVETPYGAPSDKVAIGEIGGRKVAFIPRHGRDHQLPPHVINYLSLIHI